MQHTKRRRVTSEEFRALFSSGRPVKVACVRETLGVNRATVWRLMRRHGGRRSVNHNKAFCALPEMCRFDSLGFCELRGIVFFRDGGQLAAIVRLVMRSEAGMSLTHLHDVMKVDVAMQVLRLVREGRLQRKGKPREYVYVAADEQVAAQQLARRHSALQNAEKGKARQTLVEQLAEESREDLQLLVSVLLTCLRHPQFNAKSVALSLLRRGCRTCTEQVGELFERFEIARKGGS
ncbi:MAG: hypothetical protein HQ567_10915 [Candidatus Nealsonbacteria bacterium]|nr:hypothetical protein [Candidatus Nealsonbacteria bacterium]